MATVSCLRSFMTRKLHGTPVGAWELLLQGKGSTFTTKKRMHAHELIMHGHELCMHGMWNCALRMCVDLNTARLLVPQTVQLPVSAHGAGPPAPIAQAERISHPLLQVPTSRVRYLRPKLPHSQTTAAYLVVADEAYGRLIPFAYLERIRDEFNAKHTETGRTALEGGLSSFASRLKYHMKYCMEHPDEIDK